MMILCNDYFLKIFYKPIREISGEKMNDFTFFIKRKHIQLVIELLIKSN